MQNLVFTMIKKFVFIVFILCIGEVYAVTCNNSNDCLNKAIAAKNEKDDDSYRAYSMYGCHEFNSPVNCANVATLLVAQKNYNEAFSYSIKACLSGNAHGCNLTGWQYEYGRGVGQDWFQAAQYYHIACEKKHMVACDNAGLIFGNGRWFAKDLNRALKYFNRSCELGHQDGCDHVKKYKQ